MTASDPIQSPARFGHGSAVLLLAAAYLVGCSDGRLATGRVSGSVTVDGEPLAAGKIVFKAEGTRMAIGRIEDGQILEVTTYQAGDGAPVGAQRIEIQPAIDENLAMKNPAAVAAQMRRSPVAMKYRRVQTSGLTAEIERGDNEVDLKLLSKPPR